MRKNDWILIAVVLILAMAGLGIHFFRPQQDAGLVVVSMDGEEYGSWPLSEDCIVEIEGTNRLLIEGGQADMIWADCPDKLCVHQKAIAREGESIICLPNKVVVSIAGGMERDVDAVAKYPYIQHSIAMEKVGCIVHSIYTYSRLGHEWDIREVFI